MSENRKNLAVIGCGPALGFHVAKRFAQEGYNVGMLSNMPEQLEEFAKELRTMGVEAYTYPADITDRVALKAALEKMEADMGQIDVVEYSPLAPMFGLVDVFDLTPENTQYYIDQQLYGSIEVANFFMPKMRERKDGAILITTGATAHFPMASHANGAVSQSALVQYINMLHERAEMDGVYVGTICIGAAKDDVFLANKYYEMVQERNICEYMYGNIKPTIAYQWYVNRGFGAAFPPMFTKEPMAPKGEEERDRLILALYDVAACNIVVEQFIGKKEAEVALAFAKEIAAKYGADFDKPYWGANGE